MVDPPVSSPGSIPMGPRRLAGRESGRHSRHATPSARRRRGCRPYSNSCMAGKQASAFSNTTFFVRSRKRPVCLQSCDRRWLPASSGYRPGSPHTGTACASDAAPPMRRWRAPAEPAGCEAPHRGVQGVRAGIAVALDAQSQQQQVFVQQRRRLVARGLVLRQRHPVQARLRIEGQPFVIAARVKQQGLVVHECSQLRLDRRGFPIHRYRVHATSPISASQPRC